MPLGMNSYAGLFNQDETSKITEDSKTPKRNSNRMLVEGKRLSWTNMHETPSPDKKKKKEVFSLHKYLNGEYSDKDNGGDDDDDGFDPYTADRKEWELSE